MINTLKDIFTTRKAFDAWTKEVTIVDVHEQFLITAKNGHDEQWVPSDLFKPSDLDSFNDIVSNLSTSSNGAIDLSELFRVLEQAHPLHATLIASAKSCLTALLYAHARFPFSEPVPLTRDALLRATMLLTDRGARIFEHSHSIWCPKRDEGDRLKTIFFALATTSDAGPGIVDHGGIVQVLTRLPYPKPASEKRAPRTPKGGWKSVAERLDPAPEGGEVELAVIPGKYLEPLAALVKGLLGVELSEELANAIASDAEIDMRQFLIWGEKKMHLLEGLDKLFGVSFWLSTKN